MRNTGIIGSGLYLPQRVVTNEVWEEALGLEPGYIAQRTGIMSRRWTGPGEDVVSMAVQASVAAARDSQLKRLDAIVVCRDIMLTKRAVSISLPVTDALSEAGVDINSTYGLDLVNYCPGYVYALNHARLLVGSGDCDTVLVVASTDYADLVEFDSAFNGSFDKGFHCNDQVRQFSVLERPGLQAPRDNAFLWGCGAGAVVVGSTAHNGISCYQASGSQCHRVEAFGIGESAAGNGFAVLDGGIIYRFAIGEVVRFLTHYLEKQGLSWDDIDYLLPHQPNPRILQKLAERMGLPMERVLVSCDTLGNMIAASVPVTYHLAKEQGKIRSGTRTLICSFGDVHLTVAAYLVTEGE